MVILFVFAFGLVSYAQDTTDTKDTAETTEVVKTEETKKEVSAASGFLYNDGTTNYVSLGIKFQIDATDQLSGVKKVYYITDLDNAFNVYLNPFGSFITEGKHYIAYKVEDNVGNFSAIKYFEFIMDLTAPETSISTDKPIVKLGDTIYLSAKHNFTLYAIDKLSGLKSLEYQINNDAFGAYAAPFALNGLTTGVHRINFKATDNVGNVSATTQYTFFLDNNAPTVNFDVEPVIFEKDGKKYVSSKSLVKISAQDNETGIAQILFSIDGGEYKEYKYPIEKLQNGDHTIKAKAIDLVGNESPEVELVVSVDNESPEGKIVPISR